MAQAKKRTGRGRGGKLRIGDDWNAIRIIALSQNNPLKAVAEFVENSIDAGASSITITRGRKKGEHYLSLVDNGQGVPRDQDGRPDFRYVATHICDSVKRRLKEEGTGGIQGEFGIGLLSFWTVGHRLSMTCAGDDGRAYTMIMEKGDPGYTLQRRRIMFSEPGTRLEIAPLLSGLKQFSGEKMQWYLASELRERIRHSGVDIRIVDRVSRKSFAVEPREYSGRLLHHLPAVTTAHGPVYVELYLDDPDSDNSVGLYRNGTRVLADLTELPALDKTPWHETMLQGLIDAPFLELTPATRTGVLQDDRFTALLDALEPLEATLTERIEEQRRAENERASRRMLRAIHKALREALLALPEEEYDWFDVRRQQRRPGPGSEGEPPVLESGAADSADEAEAEPQKQFFEFPGPLYQLKISPASCVLGVGKQRPLRALCRDRKGRTVDESLTFEWRIAEGGGHLDNATSEIATLHAGEEPGLVQVELCVRQGEVSCHAEAMVTVTDQLLSNQSTDDQHRQGLPGYTFQRAPGELWRSRFKADQNVVVINNGHRDFVYASRTKALKLRYITRLYAKELVLRNFPGLSADQLLERLIELSLYTEENLR